ncbi:hypothetical protein RFI_14861 [Reticulomyxa filosa]|uniref:Uncharacterized protein n=1 Tax=Reticulomyxa filosa TaxID=46433 RepID=X6N7S5_RETFI|nr:hypothetical protein RFI_14861 [Reticulomyxa filosa]|eukprot:ETO22335.1 hypothetical protein RFI_14861 [Reticulomyxa filosa]
MITEKYPSKYCQTGTGTLKKDDKESVIPFIRKFIKSNGEWELAWELVDRLFSGFQPFQSDDKAEMIAYITNSEGLFIFQFIHEVVSQEKLKTLPCCAILEMYCEWFRQLSNTILERMISVATMVSLVTHERYDSLLQLFELIRSTHTNITQYANVSNVQLLLQQFEDIQFKRQALQLFFANVSIAENHFGQDLAPLQKLYNEVKDVSYWNEINLSTAFSKDWQNFNSAKLALKQFAKMASSDIWVSIWRSLVTQQQQLWNMVRLRTHKCIYLYIFVYVHMHSIFIPIHVYRTFSVMRTFDLCQWIREKKEQLLEKIGTYDFEGYVQRFIAKEINGSTIGSLEAREEAKLINLLFSQGKVTEEDRIISRRLCGMIVETVNFETHYKGIALYIPLYREQCEKMRTLPQTDKRFCLSTVIEFQNKAKEEWQIAKKELEGKTIKGAKILKQFALLKSKPKTDIGTQVRLMYEPLTSNGERLTLDDHENEELDSLEVAVPIDFMPTAREMNAYKAIEAEFKFHVPIVHTTYKPLEGAELIKNAKSELKRIGEEQKSDSIAAKRINWESITKACGLSKGYVEWVKFISFKCLLRNPADYLARFELYADLATALRSVFDYFEVIEPLKLLRDVTASFSALHRKNEESDNKTWNDEQWIKSLSALPSFDSVSIDKIVEFWEQNRPQLPRIGTAAMKWFRLLANSNGVIKDCFERFANSQTFNEHIQSFTDDPIQGERSASLMYVRNFIVNTLTTKYVNISQMQEYLLNFAQQMNEERLRWFTIVFTSWDVIIKDTVDAQGWLYQNDKELLDRIRIVRFANESSTQRTHYVMVGSLKIYQEEKEEIEEFRRNTVDEQLTLGPQDKFDQLADRLLLHVSAESEAIEVDTLTVQQSISYMTVEEVNQLFMLHDKQLITSGLEDMSKLLENVSKYGITGKKLKALADDPNNEDCKDWLPTGESKANVKQQIIKIVQFEVLKEKVKSNFIPKFDLSKKIGEKRLQYYRLGGRERLETDRNIEFSKSTYEFEQINENWKNYLNEWEIKINRCRRDYPCLLFLTVNDMRFLCDHIKEYKQSADNSKKQGLLNLITSKLSNWKSENELERLGQFLSIFLVAFRPTSTKESSAKKNVLNMAALIFIYLLFVNINNVIVVHLFECWKKVLFCEQTTTIEQLECFLFRATPSGFAASLHCLVQPELLSVPVQQVLIVKLLKCMTHPNGLLAVITTNIQSIVSQYLIEYRGTDIPLLTREEKLQFYGGIFCGTFDEYKKHKKKVPFVQVYISKHECVGKSYLISGLANQLRLPHHFVHIPFNSSVVDRDFVVDKFVRSQSTNTLTVHSFHPFINLIFFFLFNILLMLSLKQKKKKKKMFHINISSQAGPDVNTLLFQLLVLRHLTASNGESFFVRSNHAFIVELPTELCNTLQKTYLEDVKQCFHFLGDLIDEKAISFVEVVDEMRSEKVSDISYVQVNQLQLNEKEMFVIRYLDALDKGFLKNTSEKQEPWKYETHAELKDEQIRVLTKKYYPRGLFFSIPSEKSKRKNKGRDSKTKRFRTHSMIQLKSFLRFLYCQLTQVYHFPYFQPDNAPKIKKNKSIPLHHMVVSSLVQSAQLIACEIPASDIDSKTNEEDEKGTSVTEEAEGTEEFFLVKEWKKEDSLMVKYLRMNGTTLKQDLDEAMQMAENSLGHYKKKKDQKSDVIDKSGQKEKMRLILQICGAFELIAFSVYYFALIFFHLIFLSVVRDIQVEKLLSENSDYTLTYDNILKIVAIFFRVKAAIPVLIMGETVIILQMKMFFFVLVLFLSYFFVLVWFQKKK